MSKVRTAASESSTPEPGRLLVLKVRSGFIRQGRSFTAWCKEHGIPTSNARQALMGSWNGPKGQALRATLLEEAEKKVVHP